MSGAPLPVPGLADAPAADTPAAPARAYWLAVACAAHVRRGRAGGFMQVCHGRAAPLARVRPGDVVLYYSPTTEPRGAALRAFTAVGVVRDGAPYQAPMAPNFHPFRRDVRWLEARDAPVGPLLRRLALTATPHWGYRLRAGLLRLTPEDARVIGGAMRALLPA